MNDKPKLTPRLDLKAKLASKGLKISQFARRRGHRVKTVYAVLDGLRASGPTAQKIISEIQSL